MLLSVSRLIIRASGFYIATWPGILKVIAIIYILRDIANSQLQLVWRPPLWNAQTI